MFNRRLDLGIPRSIPTAKLRQILDELPADAHIVVNQVGNLSVLVGAPGDEDNWRQIGYIDLSTETFETP